MRLPFYQVDAFTSQLFSGNPAGVCVLADWLSDSVMQAIAAENNLAETAFAVPSDGGYGLRWFTPAMEVDLCGHATLATAHVLFRHLGFQDHSIAFQTRSGILRVERAEDQLTLDFPARPAIACPAPQALIDGLGATPTEVAKSRDYLAVYDSEQAVRELRPDMDLLAQLDCLGIIATAPGDQVDFVSRFFAPRAGVDEDPVTGSAHCTLIPFWSKRLGRRSLKALQVSPRGGELGCTDLGDRVAIAGKAVTYLTGFLELP